MKTINVQFSDTIKAVPTKRFYYCEVDTQGQRTGNYYAVDLPPFMVNEVNGLFYSVADITHQCGRVEKNAFLYTDPAQCLRACLS